MDHKREGPLPDALTAEHPLFGLGYAGPVSSRPIVRLEGDALAPGSVPVAEEVPVARAQQFARAAVLAEGLELERRGLAFALLTPPPFDETHATVARGADYDAVLESYSAWLVAQRARGCRQVSFIAIISPGQ